MITDDILEKYLVLDHTVQDPQSYFFDLQITETQMHQIKQLCKITSVVNHNEAKEIYIKQSSLKQINRWRNQETELYKWVMFLKNCIMQRYYQPNYIWDQVGLYISKSPQQLQKKWQEYTLSSVNVFQSWTIDEDNVLKQLVNFHQQCRTKISWSQIGDQFNEQSKETFRTGKKCRDRWLNFLDPQIVKRKWSDQDVSQLFQFVKKFGNKWFKIGGLMQRTENDVKNKFYGIIHKNKTLENSNKIYRNKLKYEQRLQNLKEQSISNNLEQRQSQDLQGQINLASNDPE